MLLLLSIYFYSQHKTEKQQIKTNIKTNNNFFSGMFLSSLNMFSIPFFSGITALLMSINLINFEKKTSFIFVIGVFFGSYCVLYLYGKFAHFINKKTGNFNKHINLILSFITAGFGLFTIIKIVL